MIAPTSSVLTTWKAAIATAAASQPESSSAGGAPSTANTPSATLIASMNWPTLNATLSGGRRCSSWPTSTPAPTASASTLGRASSSAPVQIASESE